MIPAQVQNQALQRRVLVYVRGQRNRSLTAKILKRAGLEGIVCGSIEELRACIAEGAGMALLAEELLTQTAVTELSELMSKQPAWSDFPLVVFAFNFGERSRHFDNLGNVTYVDRPVNVRSLLAAVRGALRARERQYAARAAIEARDSFLAMLGHELRNPLGAIRLAINLMEAKQPAIAGAKEYGILDRQTRHLMRMVDDILDVARITHGKVVLKREPLDLVEVVRAAFETMESRARESQLRYELVEPLEEVWVNADRQRLDQVLANLLTNAFKYTPRGGSVTVKLVVKPTTVRILVRDSGVGLPPNMLERVFDVFSQVDSSLDRSAGGIGLGLALVRSIVELHGGSVAAESDGAGQGSTFIAELPREDTHAMTAPDSSGTPSRKRPRFRIVVVEDGEDYRMLLIALLEKLGHEVSSATTGPAGLAMILEQRPQIAIVDIGLPGMDGFQIASAARKAGFTRGLIAHSGYGQDEDKRRALEAGFDEHLSKPAPVGDISAAIGRVSARLDQTDTAAPKP